MCASLYEQQFNYAAKTWTTVLAALSISDLCIKASVHVQSNVLNDGKICHSCPEYRKLQKMLNLYIQ